MSPAISIPGAPLYSPRWMYRPIPLRVGGFDECKGRTLESIVRGGEYSTLAQGSETVGNEREGRGRGWPGRKEKCTSQEVRARLPSDKVVVSAPPPSVLIENSVLRSSAPPLLCSSAPPLLRSSALRFRQLSSLNEPHTSWIMPSVLSPVRNRLPSTVLYQQMGKYKSARYKYRQPRGARG